MKDMYLGIAVIIAQLGIIIALLGYIISKMR